MLAFIGAHIGLIWAILTALVSLFHEFVEPRWPAAAKVTAMIKAFGVDLPAVYRLLRDNIPTLPPTPPAGLAALFLFMLFGCANPTDVAVKTANGIGDLAQVAAPMIDDQCVQPINALAAQPVSSPEDELQKEMMLKSIVDRCDPIVAAFSQLRDDQLTLRTMLLQKTVTVGDLEAAVMKLTKDAQTLNDLLIKKPEPPATVPAPPVSEVKL